MPACVDHTSGLSCEFLVARFPLSRCTVQIANPPFSDRPQNKKLETPGVEVSRDESRETRFTVFSVSPDALTAPDRPRHHRSRGWKSGWCSRIRIGARPLCFGCSLGNEVKWPLHDGSIVDDLHAIFLTFLSQDRKSAPRVKLGFRLP